MGAREFTYGEYSAACHRLASGRCSEPRMRTQFVALAFVYSVSDLATSGFFHTPAKTKKVVQDDLFVLAGALGLEPRTNGFGDRDSTN